MPWGWCASGSWRWTNDVLASCFGNQCHSTASLTSGLPWILCLFYISLTLQTTLVFYMNNVGRQCAEQTAFHVWFVRCQSYYSLDPTAVSGPLKCLSPFIFSIFFSLFPNLLSDTRHSINSWLIFRNTRPWCDAVKVPDVVRRRWQNCLFMKEDNGLH